MELPAEHRVDMALARWYRRPQAGLVLLLVLTLALHFSTIMTPPELILDEQHYVADARSILAGDGTQRPEHPPLGKLAITAGVAVFGDNPLGWRFFPVLAGTISLLLFYLICRRLGLSDRVSLLAVFLLALENLSFVQASVAMLDAFYLVFMLASFLLYLRGNYITSGIVVGLSALAKLTGALALPVILLHWFLRGRKEAGRVLPGMLAAPLSFVLLMPLFDYAVSGRFQSPLERIMTMLSQTGSLTFATVSSDVLSRPWDWVLRPVVMYYWYDPHYVAAISFTVWALILPVMVYLVFRAKRSSNPALFGLAWFAGTYLVWIPASLITDRISFIFYFYAAVGSVCLGIGLVLSEVLSLAQQRGGKSGRMLKAGVAVYLLLHVAVFVVMSPVFAAWVKLFPGAPPG